MKFYYLQLRVKLKLDQFNMFLLQFFFFNLFIKEKTVFYMWTVLLLFSYSSENMQLLFSQSISK